MKRRLETHNPGDETDNTDLSKTSESGDEKRRKREAKMAQDIERRQLNQEAQAGSSSSADATRFTPEGGRLLETGGGSQSKEEKLPRLVDDPISLITRETKVQIEEIDPNEWRRIQEENGWSQKSYEQKAEEVTNFEMALRRDTLTIYTQARFNQRNIQNQKERDKRGI